MMVDACLTGNAATESVCYGHIFIRQSFVPEYFFLSFITIMAEKMRTEIASMLQGIERYDKIVLNANELV